MNNTSNQLDNLFQALSDSTRRGILMHIQERERTVSELTELYDMSMPAITKHLNILEKTGVIVRRQQGRQRLCQAKSGSLGPAIEWLNRYQLFWDERLENLKEFMEKENPFSDT